MRQPRCSIPLASALLSLALFACGGDPGPSDTGPPDAGPRDASRRPPDAIDCETDEDCEDDIACSQDSCDRAEKFCIHAPMGSACDDGVYCNGFEQCDVDVGCVAGARSTCDDGDVCTVDRCEEEGKTCVREPRDLDGDGDADFFCEGGSDCDDRDSTRNSHVAEICTDGVDNDCDGTVDEPECGRPEHDTCDDPLDVSEGGVFVVDTEGASADNTLGCLGAAYQDLVLRFTLDEPSDVRIEAESSFFTTALALRSDCDALGSEIECRTGFPARLTRRALPAGTWFVMLSGFGGGEVAVDVRIGPATEAPANDACDGAIDVSAGGTFMGSTIDVEDDVTLGCGFAGAPDVAYVLTTAALQDLRVSVTSATGAAMTWSVRPACDTAGGEVRCSYGAPASGRIHELPAGTWYLIVEGPTYDEVAFTMNVQLLPPTPPAPGDTCEDPIALELGARTVGTLEQREDDLTTTCSSYYRDVVHSFTLTERSDVSVDVESAGILFFTSIRTTCDDGEDQLRCTSGTPLHVRLRNLAAGTYYVLLESPRAASYAITVTATEPTPSTPVSGNETCPVAREIPPAGGLFVGNTATMVDDYQTRSCGVMASSPDAAFRLELTEPKRVVASTDGSSFDTVLHLHLGECVSAREYACDDDAGEGSTSLMDRILDPGVYFFVVDGWGSGTSGDYLFEVDVSDP